MHIYVWKIKLLYIFYLPKLALSRTNSSIVDDFTIILTIASHTSDPFGNKKIYCTYKLLNKAYLKHDQAKIVPWPQLKLTFKGLTYQLVPIDIFC